MDPHASDRRFGVFSLATLQLALPLEALREVVPLSALSVLPCAASCVIGGIDLRGVLVPVVDLRVVIGLPATGRAPSSVVIMIFAGRLLGLLASGVVGVFECPGGGWSPMVSRNGNQWPRPCDCGNRPNRRPRPTPDTASLAEPSRRWRRSRQHSRCSRMCRIRTRGVSGSRDRGPRRWGSDQCPRRDHRRCADDGSHTTRRPARPAGLHRLNHGSRNPRLEQRRGWSSPTRAQPHPPRPPGLEVFRRGHRPWERHVDRAATRSRPSFAIRRLGASEYPWRPPWWPRSRIALQILVLSQDEAGQVRLPSPEVASPLHVRIRRHACQAFRPS